MLAPITTYLIERIVSSVETDGSAPPTRILNVGAGKGTRIEALLAEAGCRCVCDRLDVEDCSVEHPLVGECWLRSIEDMNPVESGRYAVAFANWVLEHVADLRGAAKELYRVLSPGGLFIATVPNVSAPEFVVARRTPQSVHRLVRGRRAFHTEYAYSTIAELTGVFIAAGFTLAEERRWPCAFDYLKTRPVLRTLGAAYDKMVTALGSKRLMGHVCLVLQKPVP